MEYVDRILKDGKEYYIKEFSYPLIRTESGYLVYGLGDNNYLFASGGKVYTFSLDNKDDLDNVIVETLK